MAVLRHRRTSRGGSRANQNTLVGSGSPNNDSSQRSRSDGVNSTGPLSQNSYVSTRQPTSRQRGRKRRATTELRVPPHGHKVGLEPEGNRPPLSVLGLHTLPVAAQSHRHSVGPPLRVLPPCFAAVIPSVGSSGNNFRVSWIQWHYWTAHKPHYGNTTGRKAEPRISSSLIRHLLSQGNAEVISEEKWR